MAIKWSDWNRFAVFALFLAILIISMTFFSLGDVQERATLQTHYALNPNNLCHVLSPEDTASYVSERLAEMTDESVSPLLSLTIIGGFRNFCTEEQYKDLLPWYYQFRFLGWVLVALLLLTFKDTLLTFWGPAKKPLDALGELVHIASGLIALPIGVTSFADSVANLISEKLISVTAWIVPSAYAVDTTTSVDFSSSFLFLGQFIGISIGLIIFSSTWILGNIIEILIFASPVPFVDTILSGIRSFFIGLIMFLAYINPILGGTLALVVILVSLSTFGWSFRFLTFGFVYCIDVILRKWSTFKIDNRGVLAFSGVGVPRLKPRFLGHLLSGDEKGIVFAYYPYLIFPKKKMVVPVDSVNHGEVALTSGLIAPKVIRSDSISNKASTLFRLSPRHRKNEGSIAQYLGLPFNPEAVANKKSGLFGWVRNIL